MPVCSTIVEVIVEYAVTTAKLVTRELVKGKPSGSLLPRPRGGRVDSHIEVKSVAIFMSQYQKYANNPGTM
jgi:hypothetical protein